jgi:hypothetical protein
MDQLDKNSPKKIILKELLNIMTNQKINWPISKWLEKLWSRKSNIDFNQMQIEYESQKKFTYGLIGNWLNWMDNNISKMSYLMGKQVN